MNKDSRSHGLWEASAPPAPPTESLLADITADVVIVGGGYTGLSAALHLAEFGVKAVVLEAVEIGFGASGRNVGLVNAGMWVMPSALSAELESPYGDRLLSRLGSAPSAVFDIVDRYALDCQALRNGTLHCGVGVAGRAELENRGRQWADLGAPVELLDARQTQAAVGTKAYSSALLDHRSGTIQPLAYARGLAASALKLGASIYAPAVVVKAVDLGGAWRVETEQGSVTAPWVIVATNGYSIGAWQGLRSELVRLPYFNLSTAPLGDNVRQSILPGRQGAWDTRQILSSFRFDDAGRLIFGSVGALRGAGAHIHREWGRRALSRLFPQIADAAFEHEWYGWIEMTRNALPRVHRLARNTFSFSGYNGRGIAPGTVFGRELAELATGRLKEHELCLPITNIEPTSFRGARELSYEHGASAYHLVTDRL